MDQAALLILKKELTVERLVLVLDLAGTFVFALSGAMAAVRRRLDLFSINRTSRAMPPPVPIVLRAELYAVAALAGAAVVVRILRSFAKVPLDEEPVS